MLWLVTHDARAVAIQMQSTIGVIWRECKCCTITVRRAFNSDRLNAPALQEIPGRIQWSMLGTVQCRWIHSAHGGRPWHFLGNSWSYPLRGNVTESCFHSVRRSVVSSCHCGHVDGPTHHCCHVWWEATHQQSFSWVSPFQLPFTLAYVRRVRESNLNVNRAKHIALWFKYFALNSEPRIELLTMLPTVDSCGGRHWANNSCIVCYRYGEVPGTQIQRTDLRGYIRLVCCRWWHPKRWPLWKGQSNSQGNLCTPFMDPIEWNGMKNERKLCEKPSSH